MVSTAAIPSRFMPLMQDNRMLVDGGLLNPLSIVPEVSSHCELIIAILNSANDRNYQLPGMPHPTALKADCCSITSGIWVLTCNGANKARHNLKTMDSRNFMHR